MTNLFSRFVERFQRAWSISECLHFQACPALCYVYAWVTLQLFWLFPKGSIYVNITFTARCTHSSGGPKAACHYYTVLSSLRCLFTDQCILGVVLLLHFRCHHAVVCTQPCLGQTCFQVTWNPLLAQGTQGVKVILFQATLNVCNFESIALKKNKVIVSGVLGL